MFDKTCLEDVLTSYKENFVKIFHGDEKLHNGEKFKWKAIKCFQDNWNVNAPDFAEMLTRSLAKTDSLLGSLNRFPAKSIIIFAKTDPEEVRAMFIGLFDESNDVVSRILNFKEDSKRLHEKYGNRNQQHFQDENAISTYLWLRFPDKYYIYKYNEAKTVAERLNSDYKFKKGAYSSNLYNFYAMYDEITAELKNDTKLVNLLRENLTPDCYSDPELRTLTVDVGFYIRHPNSSAPEYSTVKHSISKPTISQIADNIGVSMEKYSKKDFLDTVFMDENSYNTLEALLKNKKNIILQGAPGVGKTFAAKKLAYAMMGEKDDSRIELIQFHQNYSYEDFIMGYRPDGKGFKLTDGIFYRFCKKAEENSDKEFFFIIDEINRGNMSKIFGELMMLIEKDYRGTKTTLAYNGLPFSVPTNLYIIGMMNTADRSLAMIDYALRRRFSFFDMKPGFDSEGFIKYQNSLNNEIFNNIIECIKQLNIEIIADKSLGKGFCIGHSYFCGQKLCTDEWIHSVIEYDILPMLAEYWFDDSSKLQRWENILRGVFQ